MTTRFSVNPHETVPSFDIRNELAHRDVFQSLLSRSKSGEALEFPEILQTHPQLRQYRSYVLDLVYEDFCQRSATGDVRQPADYAQSFPEYRTQIAQLLDVHRFFHSTGQVPDWLTDQTTWPAPDQVFLGYRICGELGRGAIGRVYLAQELELSERFVALKVSPYGHEEAKLLAKLNHPHVVPINSIKADPESSLSAVCMPFKGRTTLADLKSSIPFDIGKSDSAAFWEELAQRGTGIKSQTIEIPAAIRKRPYVDTVLDLLIQIAQALEYVHERRILHRDLKPSNILITPERVAMLLDFNLSTDLAEVQNRIGGTLPYMSPEQIQQVLINPGPISTLDERTDLYSIGVIGYELLCGNLPFPADELGIVNKQQAENFIVKIQAGMPSLLKCQPTLDRRTANIIAKCLEADRSKRLSSAKELVLELEACRTSVARLKRTALRHPRWLFAIAIGIAVALLAVTLFLSLRPALHVRETKRAWEHLEVGERSLARDHFREALAAEPNAVDALNGLGRTDFLSGEYKSAENSWIWSYKLQPDPRLAACLGFLDSLQNKPASGLAWLKRAQPELSNSAELLCNLATSTRLQRGELQTEALTLYSQALEIEPRLRPALIGRAQTAFSIDKNSKQPLRTQILEDIDLAVALPIPSPELLATAAKYHLAANPGSAEHQQLAKGLAIRALEEGLSFPELTSLLPQEKLLQDPAIQQYQGKAPAPRRQVRESIWADPWPALFQKP